MIVLLREILILKNGLISRDNNNEFIFTGLQILDESVFSSIKDKIFSMNKIWNYLIKKKSLIGNESKQKFYHLNTKEMFDKISNLNLLIKNNIFSSSFI